MRSLHFRQTDFSPQFMLVVSTGYSNEQSSSDEFKPNNAIVYLRLGFKVFIFEGQPELNLPYLGIKTVNICIYILSFFLQGTFSTLTQLTKLDLSKNKLTELPMDFGHLVNLERLDLYCNNLTALPTSFIHLKKLTWLDLKGNPIQTLLPDVVGNCLSAQECKQCAHSVSATTSKTIVFVHSHIDVFT